MAGNNDRKHWKHLYEEIVATEICCSCSACIVACPHKVLELQDWDPVQKDGNSPFDNCIHGEEGCSLCAMACLRLDPHVDLIEKVVYGERRRDDQAEGSYRSKTLARATDERIVAKGQDGGAVSALLAWGLDNGELDGAVLAAPSERVPWLDEPHVVTTSEELLATAGSRYTYCATPLGLKKAADRKLKSIAMVGVSCESTAVRQLAASGIKRWTRPVKLVIGLMCCETFDYEAFMVGKVEQELGIPLRDITKVNVKGKVIVTLNDGNDVDIPLKEARPYANEWCHHCPDFAAEHADLSCGGLGMEGWTMILVRSERGEDYLNRAVEAGVLELRPAEEEPKALEVMDRLAKKQRARVKADDPHAAAAYATTQALEAARVVEAEKAADKAAAG
ncbi:MAG TPA: Coenzyme F420 hydrogenase/dehydrogenase, beta subunit C-terminal domain [Actinomycetota bacterium]|nr:Coenzyme F420 hydrogenase/dehydrogenase, beta subunit C-terminal domain [Actinomycetota bacterium]